MATQLVTINARQGLTVVIRLAGDDVVLEIQGPKGNTPVTLNSNEAGLLGMVLQSAA